jgi:hypothetical protein
VGDTFGDGHARLLDDAKFGCDGVWDCARVADRGEFNDEHPFGELVDHVRGDLDGQASFADATDPGQGDETMGGHCRFQFGHLVAAADETGGLRSKVARCSIQRLEGRELGAQPVSADLEDVERLREITQLTRSEIN